MKRPGKALRTRLAEMSCGLEYPDTPSGMRKEWPKIIQAMASTRRPLRQSVGFDLSPMAPGEEPKNEGSSTSLLQVPLLPMREKA